MHETLLFAQIPSSSHSHILKILAGISAMQPLPILEYHLLFKPTRSSASLPLNTAGRPPNQTPKPGSQIPASISQAQAGNDLFYLRLVGDLTQTRVSARNGTTETGEVEGSTSNISAVENPSRETESDDVEMLDAEPQASSAPQATQSRATTEETSSIESIPWSNNAWALKFKNLPDVLGKRPATSRLICSIPIRDGSPRSLVEGLGYAYVSAYMLSGDRFTHGSISIRLFRTIPVPNGNTTIPTFQSQSQSQSTPPSTSAPTPTPTPIPSIPTTEQLQSLTPLDPANSYTLETSIRVTDGSKPDLMNRAFAELVAFRDLLKGVVTLVPVERLVLDPRIRNVGGGGSGSGSGSGANGANRVRPGGAVPIRA